MRRVLAKVELTHREIAQITRSDRTFQDRIRALSNVK